MGQYETEPIYDPTYTKAHGGAFVVIFCILHSNPSGLRQKSLLISTLKHYDCIIFRSEEI